MTQHTFVDGRLGALAVHDEIAYNAVRSLPVALLAHLRRKLKQDSSAWTVIPRCKLQQRSACLWLHVRGVDDCEPAGAQTLVNDAVKDSKCS
jgi:hypothetical protein